ncbi:hypothetical protein SAMN06265355_104325 [Actinomadura mexicana]|uniref:Uncharacterized protein n=1 Tax=Actinomadura mexicana TaxID=134959 RepID=A0A238XH96_9ACTN|nr:hypothetical protein SAMN06265355_104325 [Actinomadura mexicana]
MPFLMALYYLTSRIANSKLVNDKSGIFVAQENASNITEKDIDTRPLSFDIYTTNQQLRITHRVMPQPEFSAPSNQALHV